MNTDNKLFLATATAWNVESTIIPYKWLAEGIDTYTNDGNLTNIALDLYRKDKEENIAFTKKMLQQADINISDIYIESKEVKRSDNPAFFGGLMIDGQIIQPQEQYEFKIATRHEIKTKENIEKNYILDLNEESLGTQALFFLAPLFKQTFEQGKVLVIDELDASLHPFIVKFLVNMFRNPEINKNGSQLIFTTHETGLLSLDIFRKDEIYFTEKDSSTGDTHLYSLADFSIRKSDNIEKGYLLGRYGAVPFIRDEGWIDDKKICK